jgi:DNA repair exonuclease SbcCD ATPase subunit
VLITGLRAKNWACHPVLDLKFKAGLNGVLGVNGSGKSSILDALRFGVTNKAIAAGSRADNLRTGQKNGFVEVDFTHGDSEFTVRRVIEIAKGKMTMGEQTWTKATEIDEYLEQLLQTKMDALLNNVFVGQHALDDILFKTNTERLKEFQDTFGLTRMADAYRLLSAEIASCNITPGLHAQRDLLVAAAKEAHQELAIAAQDMQKLDQQINDLMGISEKVVLHESLLQLQESREKSLAVLGSLDSALRDDEKVLTQAKNAVEALNLELAQNSESVIAAVALIGTYKTSSVQRKTLNDDLQRVNAVQPPTESESDIQPAYEKESGRCQTFRSMAKGEMPLPAMSGDAELAAEYEVVSKKAVDKAVSVDVVVLLGNLEREQKTLTTFASGSCPTCLRPMESFDPVLQQKKVAEAKQALQEAQEAHRLQIQLAKHRADQISAELTKRKALAFAAVNKALAASQATCDALGQKLNGIRKAEAAYAAAQVRKAEIEASLRNVPVILLEAATAAEECVRANTDRVSKLTALNTQVSIVSARIASTKQEHARVLAAMPSVDGKGLMTPEEYAVAKATELELNKLFVQKRDVETRMGIAQAKIANQEATVTQLNVQIEAEGKAASWSKLCSRARDVIHVSGLPMLMMKEYATRINRRVAHYLQVWEAPFRLVLDDNLSFKAVFDTGFELPAARLSGGQKIVASTSFRLAMSDTFAKNVGLLILDEPTNHLDKGNVVHLQQLLVKLKQMSGAAQRQIIIVTHEEQLVGFFDHTIQLANLT